VPKFYFTEIHYSYVTLEVKGKNLEEATEKYENPDQRKRMVPHKTVIVDSFLDYVENESGTRVFDIIPTTSEKTDGSGVSGVNECVGVSDAQDHMDACANAIVSETQGSGATASNEKPGGMSTAG
jgi:hypothetical protein